MAKIYVASSWRNEYQPAIVALLRESGHEVYDFKNPPNGTGFSWSELDPDWQKWTAIEYREMLQAPRAAEGYRSDMAAMEWADTCVLVLPCGRSAHLEAGWFAGKGKQLIILTRTGEEPELMAKMADFICVNQAQLLSVLAGSRISRVMASPNGAFDRELQSCHFDPAYGLLCDLAAE